MEFTIQTVSFLLLVFAAYTIQAMTGFGGPLLAMPIAILLLGMAEAKGILTVLAWVTALCVAIPNRKQVNWREVLKILSLMAVGMALGLWFYASAPKTLLLRVYGAVVLVVAVRNLFFSKALRTPDWVMWIIPLLAGVMQGMFVSGGAFLIIYVSRAFTDKDEFRASSSMVWSVANAVMVAANLRAGLLTADDLPLLAVSLAVALLAVWLGGRLQRPMSMAAFKKVIYGVLLVSGLILLYNSL